MAYRSLMTEALHEGTRATQSTCVLHPLPSPQQPRTPSRRDRMQENYTDYEHLPRDEDDSQTTPRPPRQRPWLRIFGIVSLVLLSTILGAALGSIRPLKQYWQPTSQVKRCGHTSSQARARGCVLEPMIYGWIAPECQYPEVTEANDPWEKWQWYRDENFTQPISREQLDRAEVLDLWTNRAGYHLQHCLFLYRKLMYAVDNKVQWIDTKTLAAHHAYHCIDQLGTSTEMWNATTWTGLAMYDCVRSPWAE